MNLLSIVSQPTPNQINTAARSNLKNVTRWSTPVSVNSNGLGAAVTVSHDLGTVPNRIAIEPYIDSRWWADQDDRNVWSKTTAVFHTSHAGVFIVRLGLQ